MSIPSRPPEELRCPGCDGWGGFRLPSFFRTEPLSFAEPARHVGIAGGHYAACGECDDGVRWCSMRCGRAAVLHDPIAGESFCRACADVTLAGLERSFLEHPEDWTEADKMLIRARYAKGAS